MWDCKPNKSFPYQLDFWRWCFVMIEILTKASRCFGRIVISQYKFQVKDLPEWLFCLLMFSTMSQNCYQGGHYAVTNSSNYQGITTICKKDIENNYFLYFFLNVCTVFELPTVFFLSLLCKDHEFY